MDLRMSISFTAWKFDRLRLHKEFYHNKYIDLNIHMPLRVLGLYIPLRKSKVIIHSSRGEQFVCLFVTEEILYSITAVSNQGC